MIGYEVVDMFAERPYAGSPLCVVPEAQGLSGAAMRAIAAEVNTAETAFVLPPTVPEAAYRVRVFTPLRESAHGGHSAVGTAATLARLGVLPPGRTVQECGAGRQELVVADGRAELLGRGALPGSPLAPGPLLAAAGLSEHDLADAEPGSAGYGGGFAFLPVRADAVAGARLDRAALAAAGLPALCLVAWDSDRRCAHTRLFAPGFDLPEDPACAPVAMGLGVWLVRTGWLPGSDGTHAYTVRQGEEVGRPARLECTVSVEGGEVAHGGVTGDVVPVALGRAVVPVEPADGQPLRAT
ncbi:PhzF family phenazine biosynthesis protein [Nocardiopsis sp. NPDC050513]|uniref:PhzF family phenazine biosynthesis protein n=1 Tax=Nocardiopsis sp. NPDC050513 TaxID=3364338 RepID=UPI00379CC11A